MDPRKREMSEVARGLPTKSEKIRRLGAAGFTRQQIADFLGIRYQHVRNVLIDAERKKHPVAASPATSEGSTPGMEEQGRSWRGEAHKVVVLDVGRDGSVLIPARILAELGFPPSERVTLVPESDGRIRVLSSAESLKYAQQIVAESTRPGVSLVEELLKMRREEFEKEEREYQEMQERLRRR